MSSLTIVSSERGDDGDRQECKSGSDRAHFQFLFFLLTFGGLIKISMCLELEDEVRDVDKEQHDGSSARDDEKTRSAMLLDGTRLAGLHKDTEIVIDGLGHEISGRDDERFCKALRPD